MASLFLLICRESRAASRTHTKLLTSTRNCWTSFTPRHVHCPKVTLQINRIRKTNYFSWYSQPLKSLRHKILRRTTWIPVIAGGSVSTLGYLCWAPGLSFLQNWRKKDTSPVLSEEIMAQIPKAVLRKDKAKPNRHSNILVRILFHIWGIVRYVVRFVRIIVTFCPLLTLYPFMAWNERLKLIYWKILLFALERTGATFIKLGQWAGTRRDLFSAEFCDLFSKLHVHTRAHSWHLTKYRMRKAFGRRWREIFVKVHKKPVGSGCIAQVHEAYMRADLIPDEALVDEIMEEESDEPEIDFAEGLEIVGLGGIQDEIEDMSEEISSSKFFKRSSPSTNTPSASDVGVNSGQSEELSADTPESTPPGDWSGQKLLSDDEEELSLVPVAIKVLHPGVYSGVKRDLRILRRLAWFTEKLFPSLKWLSLRECAQEFSVLMMKQVDLRMEAECLEQFNENFQEHPNIRFPKPVWPYCKRSVLVETFEDGEPLTSYLVEDGEDLCVALKEKLAGFGVDALLQMIFVDNFVHGDLHPGNILVQKAKDYVPQDENKLMLVDVGDTVIVHLKQIDCPVRMVMLDVGITASLSEEDLENFKAVFTSVVIGEGSQVAELMLRHASHNECTDVDSFKEELGHIVMQARKDTISLGKIQVGKLLSDVFSTLSRHKVKMESNFVSVLLAIFVLEGLGRSLDPELDILERAKPILLG